jgi:hypothetical protein
MNRSCWRMARLTTALALAVGVVAGVAGPASAATRHRRVHSVRRHVLQEDTYGRCVYCGAYAVTVVVVNGGAIPVCVRHAANPEGDDGLAPAFPILDTLAPIPYLALPNPDARRSGPPVLPPADGLLLPEEGPAAEPLAARTHRAIRRRSRAPGTAAPHR